MLTSKSIGVYTSQQTQSALNMNVRTAAAQIQNDVLNAGTGYFPTYNIPGAPLGVTVSNVSSGYDKLTILSFDSTIIAHPTASPAYTTTGTMNVAPVGTTAATLAAGYGAGDTLVMFSNTVDSSSGMPTVTSFPLTAAGSVSGSTVNLTFTPNVAPVAGTPGTGTWPGDPLGISSTYGVSDPIVNDDGTTSPGICYLGTSFDSSDWVLKATRIVYYVDPATAQLYRQINSGTPQAIATNILGFKIGVLLYGGTTDSSTYTYLPSGTISDSRKIRSLRISFIGRTTKDVNSPFRNSYDGGPYRLEGMSFIVNPRNLSIHD